MRKLTAFLVSAGFALVLSSVSAVLACHFGFLFGGVDTFVAVSVATVCCAIAAPVTALVFKRRGKPFTSRTLFIEVTLLTFVAVGLLSWLQTRQELKILMDPAPIPKGVHVYRGQSIFFSSYVHFTAAPAAIASIIQSKELVEVPAKMPDQKDISGYVARQQTNGHKSNNVPLSWWQPATMSNPRFLYRHHDSAAVQGWSEGWWVNGSTNEVYAFISG
jgi:hypothetical protein